MQVKTFKTFESICHIKKSLKILRRN